MGFSDQQISWPVPLRKHDNRLLLSWTDYQQTVLLLKKQFLCKQNELMKINEKLIDLMIYTLKDLSLFPCEQWRIDFKNCFILKGHKGIVLVIFN